MYILLLTCILKEHMTFLETELKNIFLRPNLLKNYINKRNRLKKHMKFRFWGRILIYISEIYYIILL
jgi:hypothetical protein